MGGTIWSKLAMNYALMQKAWYLDSLSAQRAEAAAAAQQSRVRYFQHLAVLQAADPDWEAWFDETPDIPDYLYWTNAQEIERVVAALRRRTAEAVARDAAARVARGEACGHAHRRYRWTLTADPGVGRLRADAPGRVQVYFQCPECGAVEVQPLTAPKAISAYTPAGGKAKKGQKPGKNRDTDEEKAS